MSKPRNYDHLRRCEQILRNILDRCNASRAFGGGSDAVVGFGPDWGGNSLTVFIDDSHTHVGMNEGLSLAIYPDKQ